MADMKFLGFKEVTLSYFSGLTDTQKVGYIWFVGGDTAESGGDIYLGYRHYGRFAAEEEAMKALKKAGLIDEDGNVLNVNDIISGATKDLATKADVETLSGSVISLSGAVESITISRVVEKYTDALSAATDDTKGQIIYVEKETYKYNDGEKDIYVENTSDIPVGIEYITLKKGPYIVNGANNISYVETSEPGTDIASKVEALQEKITALEELSEGLYWETDDDILAAE